VHPALSIVTTLQSAVLSGTPEKEMNQYDVQKMLPSIDKDGLVLSLSFSINSDSEYLKWRDLNHPNDVVVLGLKCKAYV